MPIHKRFKHYVAGVAVKDVDWLNEKRSGVELKMHRRQNFWAVPIRQIVNNATFSFQAKDAMIRAMENDGACYTLDYKLVEVDRQGNETDIFNGKIKFEGFIATYYPDRTEYSGVAIFDPITYLVGRLKDKTDITVATTRVGSANTAVSSTNINLFNTGNDNILAACPMYSVHEICEYLVEFAYDGDVTYSSTLTGPGGDLEGLHLVLGQALRLRNDYPPLVSFADIINALQKTHNVFLYVDWAATPITMGIEYIEDGWQETVGTSFTPGQITTEGVIQTLPEETYKVGQEPYSGMPTSIKLGSPVTVDFEEATTDSATSKAYPDFTVITHLEETFLIEQPCIDPVELNLVPDIIYDTNTIREVTQHGNSDYDDRLFFIDVDTSTNKAKSSDVFGAGTFYIYNEQFQNKEILLRHLDVLPGSLVKYLSDGNDAFQAEKTTTDSSNVSGNLTLNPVDYDDDSTGSNDDPGGNYNTTTYRYTCPLQGYYIFDANLVITALSLGDQTHVDCQILIRRYSSTSVLLETATFDSDITSNGTVSATGAAFNLDTGDYVQVEATLTNPAVGPTSPSYDVSGGIFRTSFVASAGGIADDQDGKRYRGVLIEVKVVMSLSEYLAMQDKWNQAVYLDLSGHKDLESFTGWIRTADYELDTGITWMRLFGPSESLVHKT